MSIRKLMNVGLGVFAKDQGATKTLRGISETSQHAVVSLESLGDMATRSMQRFNSAIGGLQLFQLNQIKEALESVGAEVTSLAESVTDGVAMQSTSLESFGVEFANTYRQATVGLGDFKEIVDKVRPAIRSLAYELDVSADDMLAVNVRLAQLGMSLDEFGISQRELAGLLKAGIVSGEEFAGVLTSLARGYGLGAEGTKKLLDEFVAIGEAVGDVGGVMQAVPSVLEKIDEQAARFPQVGKHVDRYASSMARLGAVFRRMGLAGTVQEGIEQASSVFEALMTGRQELANIMVGLGGEFPEIARELGIAYGNVEEAFNAIREDPLEFARKMVELRERLRGTAMEDRFLAKMKDISNALGFTVQSGDQAIEAFQAIAQASANSSGALDRVGKAGAKQARTLDERLQRLQDRFETRLNRMTRDLLGGEQEIYRRRKNAYDVIISGIENAVSQQGTLTGVVARSWLKLRAGAEGIVASFNTMFGGLMDTFSQLMPMIVVLNQTGVLSGLRSGLGSVNRVLGGLPGKILGVLGPVTLLGGAAILISENWNKLGPMVKKGWAKAKKIFGDIVKWFKTKFPEHVKKALNAALDFSKFLKDQAARFANWVKSIDWGQAARDLVQRIRDAVADASDTEWDQTQIGQIADNIKEAFKQVAEAAAPAVRDAGSALWDEFVQWMQEPGTTKGKMQRAGMAAGVGAGVLLANPLTRGLTMSIGKKAIGAGVSGGLKFLNLWGRGFGAAAKMGLKGVPLLGALIGPLFEIPKAFELAKQGDISGALSRIVYGAVDGFLLGIPSIIDSLTGTTYVSDALVGPIKSMFDSGLGAVEDFFAGDFAGGLAGLVTANMKAMSLGPEWILSLLGVDTSGFWDGLEEAMSNVFEAIGSTVDPIMDFVSELGEVVWDTLGAVIPDIEIGWKSIKSTFSSLSSRVSSWFTKLGKSLADYTEGWDQLGNAMKLVFNDVIDGAYVIAEFIKNAGKLFDSFKSYVSSVFKHIGTSITTFFTKAFLKAGDKVMTLAETIKMAFLGIKASIIGTLLKVFQSLAKLPGVGRLMEPVVTGLRDRTMEVAREQIRVAREISRAQEERARALQRVGAATEETARQMAERRRALERLVSETARAGLQRSQERRRARQEAERRAAQPVEAGAPAVDYYGPFAPEGQPVAEATPAQEEATARTGERAGRSAAERERRRQAERARREARQSARRRKKEVVVLAFGAEAAQQLAEALTIQMPRGGAPRVRPVG